MKRGDVKKRISSFLLIFPSPGGEGMPGVRSKDVHSIHSTISFLDSVFQRDDGNEVTHFPSPVSGGGDALPPAHQSPFLGDGCYGGGARLLKWIWVGGGTESRININIYTRLYHIKSFPICVPSPSGRRPITVASAVAVSF